MTLSEYLENVSRTKSPGGPLPEREPGCDDDRKPGEDWRAYCYRLALTAIEWSKQ